MTPGPWVDAWRNEPDDALFDALVEMRAKPIEWRGTDPEELVQKFLSRAKEVFVCDIQIRKILRDILAVGRAHAADHFGSEAVYEERVFSIKPWRTLADEALALTGLSGVGKTQLLAALARLLESRQSIFDTQALRRLPLELIWIATVRDSVSVLGILKQLLNGTPKKSTQDSLGKSPDESRATKSKHPDLVRQRSYRNGICLLIIDELQFGSRGSASAAITSLVLRLMGYGPLVLYACNFSLLHKLRERPGEDQRRLLTRAIEMKPHSRADADWRRYLHEVMELLPGIWAFTADVIADDLLRFTFGVRDYAVKLLGEALRVSRAEGGNCRVEKRHLEEAYRSVRYAAIRHDVELLIGGRVAGTRRTDLWSPLTARDSETRSPAVALGDDKSGTHSAAGAQVEKAAPSVVVSATAAIRAHESRIMDAMQREQTPTERRKDLEAQGNAPKSQPKKATVHPIRPRSKPSPFEEMIAAAADLVKGDPT